MKRVKPCCEMDELIGNYILGEDVASFDDIIKDDERLEVATYLSPIAKGLLGWYFFESSDRVLQVGGWFGAFSEMIASRCEQLDIVEVDDYRAYITKKRLEDVENICVISRDLQEYIQVCSPKYDVVVYAVDEKIERISTYQEYMQIISMLKTVLKKEGRLFFACSNRFGVKFFCGEPDPATGIRFDGMTENNSSLYRFDRNELLTLFRDIGFKNIKLYYPMPDHRSTQLIYTDEYPPQNDMRERLHIYVENKTKRLLDEPLLVDKLLKNEVMTFFSNSYLIEASDDILKPLIYSTLSTEREPQNSFATNIYNNGIVEKIPLYSEGKKSIQNLIQNITELSKRRIPVLDMKNISGVAQMKRIEAPSLSTYLKQCVRTDKDEFIRLIDKLWEYILDSSEEVS